MDPAYGTVSVDGPPSPLGYSSSTYKPLDTNYSYTAYKPPSANYSYVAYKPPVDANSSNNSPISPMANSLITSYKSSDTGSSYTSYKPPNPNNQYTPYRPPANRLSDIPQGRPSLRGPVQYQRHSIGASLASTQVSRKPVAEPTEPLKDQPRPHLRIETSNVYRSNPISGGVTEVRPRVISNPVRPTYSQASNLANVVSPLERFILPLRSATWSHEQEPARMGIIRSSTTPANQCMDQVVHHNRYSYLNESAQLSLTKSNTNLSAYPQSANRNPRSSHRRVVSEADLFMGDAASRKDAYGAYDYSSDEPDELEESALSPYQSYAQPLATFYEIENDPAEKTIPVEPLRNKPKSHLPIETPYIVPNSESPHQELSESDIKSNQDSAAAWELEYAALMRILSDKGGLEDYQPVPGRESRNELPAVSQQPEATITPIEPLGYRSKPRLPAEQSQTHATNLRHSMPAQLAADAKIKPQKGRMSGFFARILPPK